MPFVKRRHHGCGENDKPEEKPPQIKPGWAVQRIRRNQPVRDAVSEIGAGSPGKQRLKLERERRTGCLRERVIPHDAFD